MGIWGIIFNLFSEIHYGYFSIFPDHLCSRLRILDLCYDNIRNQQFDGIFFFQKFNQSLYLLHKFNLLNLQNIN